MKNIFIVLLTLLLAFASYSQKQGAGSLAPSLTIEGQREAARFWGNYVAACVGARYVKKSPSVFVELRGFRVEMDYEPLTQADRLNGVQAKGYSRFNASAHRFYSNSAWQSWGNGIPQDMQLISSVRFQKSGSRWSFRGVGYFNDFAKTLTCSELPGMQRTPQNETRSNSVSSPVLLTGIIQKAAMREKNPRELQKWFLRRITQEDMQLILQHIYPDQLKRLAENPAQKTKYVENFKEFFAVASEAVTVGLAASPKVRDDLEYIRLQILARVYDQEINKTSVPFGLISSDKIKEFYAVPGNQAKFNAFVKDKMREDALSASDLDNARNQYARVRIYAREAEQKAQSLGSEFPRKVELSVRLQQAAYLNQLYAEKILSAKTNVTSAEISQYFQAHSEIDPMVRKAKAADVLKRALAGEDFEQLARRFSDDPRKEENGGLYQNVRKGDFDRQLEDAALALNVGQIGRELVETPFGYHVVKLERKFSAGKNGEEPTYELRHILISTIISDPKNPFQQPMPAADYARTKLKSERERKIIDEIKANNPVEIEDFEIP